MRVLTDGRRCWVPQNRWDLVAGQRRYSGSVDVAVIVPYFEQQESLQRMYAALAVAQLDPARTEIVVVDDGSATPPPPPPAALALEVNILRQADEGCRPGAARNLGAASTQADVLVFLDADTLPEPFAVGRLAEWPALMPDALVVGRRGHVDLTGWRPGPTGAWLTGTGAAPPRRRDPAWLELGYRTSRNLLDADERSFRYVISAVLACHRSLFDDIGGFDATRAEYGGDDWEFASRAFTNGAVLVHDPAALAWHDEPDWADRHGTHGAHRGSAGDGGGDSAAPDAEDGGAAARIADKAAETLWLAAHIPEPRTSGPGLIHRYSDTIVLLDLPATTPAAVVVAAIQGVLAELPSASVHLPDGVGETVTVHVANDPRVRRRPAEIEELRRARAVVTLMSPLAARRDRPCALAELVAEVGAGGPGWIDVVALADLVATVVSNRAIGRARRAVSFGLDAGETIEQLFGRRKVEAAAAGLRLLPADLDLATWLAGEA